MSAACDGDFPPAINPPCRLAFRPCADFSALGPRVHGVEDNESGVFHPAIGIFITPCELFPQGFARHIAAQVNAAGGRQYLAASQMIIEKQSKPDERARAQAPVMRQDKAQGPDDVGSGLQQNLALNQSFAHQPEFIMLKIAQAAMYEFG